MWGVDLVGGEWEVGSWGGGGTRAATWCKRN